MNVQDILRLPSMKGAKIVAGESQKHQLMTTISVLEVSEPSLYSQMPIKGEYSGNELVLTSFAQIAESIEKQLEIVSILHQHNQLGIVLYYVGLIMPSVSEELINRMNELKMVLIQMPLNRIDLRYSEVISEALSYINEEENEQNPQQDVLLETIRHLPPPNQIETALSILSDRFKCSLFVESSENEVLLSKAWPRSLDQSLREVIAEKNEKKNEKEAKKNSPIELNQMYYFQTTSYLTLTGLDNRYYLTIFKKAPLGEKQLEGIRKIVEKAIKYFGEEQLLNIGQQFFSACQTGDYHTAALLAQKEGINVNTPLKLYCLQRKAAKRDEFIYQLRGIYYKEQELEWVITNSTEISFGSIVSSNDERSDYLFISGEFKGLSSVSNQMGLIKNQLEDSKKVFPRKRCFHPEDLYLLQDVTRDTVSIYLERYLEKELIETLAVYFLDCDENISAASEVLFLHNNTIKYRLKRAQERLKLSFSHTASCYLLIKNLIYYRKYTQKH